MKPDITKGQHIGTVQVKDQEHFRCPRADTTQRAQAFPDIVVTECVEALGRIIILDESLRDVLQVFSFSSRQATGTQRGNIRLGNINGLHLREHACKPAPDSSRCGY